MPQKILCADDDMSMLLLYQKALETRDYEITTCLDGDEVMKHLEHNIPDLMLLDIQMPKMTGLEVCEQMRKKPQLSKVPVVIVSATDKENIIVEALTSGAEDYLVKPIKPSELLAKVSVVLQNHSSGVSEQGASPGTTYAENYFIVSQLGFTSGTSVYYGHDMEKVPPMEVILKQIHKKPDSLPLTFNFPAS